MAKFQVMLAGEWKDFAQKEDRILKRSFMAGYPNCRFSLRGASYEYGFDRMVQKSLTTGKERKIRAPHRWQQPARPIVPKGPTLSMLVPAGSPGTTIQIDHPKVKGAHIQVAVPKYAKVGQPMLVPLPDVAVATDVSVVTAGVISVGSCMSNANGNDPTSTTPVAVEAAQETTDNATDNYKASRAAPVVGNVESAKRGWSTRARVAAAGAAVAALGGGACLAAVVVTEASDGGGEGPSAASPALPDDGWTMWCPATADAYGEFPEEWGGVGEGAIDGATPEDGVDSMCGDGDDGGTADDVGIVDADDDGEWIADMCGLQDEVSGDGSDAIADFVVDLF